MSRYCDAHGGYHEYRGGIPSFVICVLWGDIMTHVGDIMSIAGVFSTIGVLK